MTRLLRLNPGISYILLWLVLLSLPVLSQVSMPDSYQYEQSACIDSIQTEHTLPDSMLNPYLTDEDFMKMFEESADVSLWGGILGWLWEHILRHIFSESLMPFWEIIFYVVILGIFAYFISRFFKISPGSLFYGQKKRRDQTSVSAIRKDDLKSDLAERLNQAIHNKDFREALRILFVRTLKKLNQRKHIILSIGKTNLEYFQELTDPEVKAGFQQLTLIFDYVWYGEFPLSEERYTNFQNFFNEYHKRLDG